MRIFSIGHSNRDIGEFVDLLLKYEIEVVVDVRSAPYSRYVPQYNHGALRKSLSDKGIQYLYKGRTLGGRSEDPTHYVDGRLDYGRLGESTAFVEGLKQIKQLACGHRVVLMCSEEDPLMCHRGILIGRKLREGGDGIEVMHIRGDEGRLESQEVIEHKLCVQQGLLEEPRTMKLYTQAGLWQSEQAASEATAPSVREVTLAKAYAAQEARIAPRKSRPRAAKP